MFLVCCLGLLGLVGLSVASPAAAKPAPKSKAVEASAPVAEGPVRRAFVVGIKDYTDPSIQRLERSLNDANDVASVLQDVGFDKKNVKVALNLKTRSDFQKSLGEFMKSVKPGDEVFFFFSGHGYASRVDDSNYVLFAQTKSLNTFTRGKLQSASEKELRAQAADPALVRLKARDYEINYEIEEIQKVGISDEDIQKAIEQGRPSVAIVVLDACRTLARTDAGEASAVRSGLHVRRQAVHPGFAVIYSASEGEAAIESFGFGKDQRRNSLFTDILRTAVQRPGMTLTKMFEQLRAQVSAVAERRKLHQHPEMIENGAAGFRFVPSVGAERFALPKDSDYCWASAADLAAVKQDTEAPEDRLITHVLQYAGCPSAVEARAELARIRKAEGRWRHPDGDCDDLAASPDDPDLRGRAGVPLDRIGRLEPPRDRVPQAGQIDEYDTRHVVDVCTAAVKDNPRISRYLLNLARAEHAHGRDPRVPAEERADYLQRARADYETLANAGNFVAMAELATFYMNGGAAGGDVPPRQQIDHRKALELMSKAAQQGVPMAQYRLGLFYAHGYPEADLKYDPSEARHWMGLASRAGYMPATRFEAEFEEEGFGNPGRRRNPALAVDLYRRVARSGSPVAVVAEYRLGLVYFYGSEVGRYGAPGTDAPANGKPGGGSSTALGNDSVDPATVSSDAERALIWFGRASAHGDPGASYMVSYMLENARGVAEPRQQLAARYLRTAAEAGSSEAKVKYVEKILGGEMVLRFEDRTSAIERLLKQAFAAGNGRAALMLARRSWSEERGGTRDAVRAAAYAFAAIDLAAQIDPSRPAQENEFGPLTEIAAGQFLVMLGHDPAAVDGQGQPLFSKAELDTLEKYYGIYDEKLGKVNVKIASIFDFVAPRPQEVPRRQLWIWDWGRAESPTEQQFRNLELDRGTTFYDWVRDSYYRKERSNPATMKEHPEYITQNMVRDAIADVYRRSKSYKVPFLDLLSKKLDMIGQR